MREPWFWRDLDPKSRAAAPLTRFLLSPFAALYAWGGQRKLNNAKGLKLSTPVICIGNLTVGGAGKTPVSAAIRARLSRKSLRVGTLSRGYGGTEKGPLRVDPARHLAAQVGDEPLMLSTGGESWISRDRAAGASAMAADGAQVILLDDGHQNPSVDKDLSVVVIDATHPFGNGHVFPKGPLREPVSRGLSRAHAVVLMGDGPVPELVEKSGKPVLRARLAASSPLPAGQWVAFAGIGRPERFFDALRALPDVQVTEAVPFGDHHAYTSGDISYLKELAKSHGSRLVTTEKDYVRLPADFRALVQAYIVKAVFDDPESLDALLAPVIARARP